MSGRRMVVRSLALLGLLVPLRLAVAQQSAWSVRFGGGLGVSATSMPALVDYANLVGRPAVADRADDFQIVASLIARGDIRVSAEWAIGLQYERFSKTISSTPNSPGAGWEFEATASTPSVVLKHIVVDGDATIELGGGIGYSSGTIRQRYVPASAEETFTGSGWNALLEAAIRAPLDENFGAGITGLVEWTRIATLKNGAGRTPTYSGQTANLSCFALAVQFVLTYQF